MSSRFTPKNGMFIITLPKFHARKTSIKFIIPLFCLTINWKCALFKKKYRMKKENNKKSAIPNPKKNRLLYGKFLPIPRRKKSMATNIFLAINTFY